MDEYEIVVNQEVLKILPVLAALGSAFVFYKIMAKIKAKTKGE